MQVRRLTPAISAARVTLPAVRRSSDVTYSGSNWVRQRSRVLERHFVRSSRQCPVGAGGVHGVARHRGQILERRRGSFVHRRRLVHLSVPVDYRARVSQRVADTEFQRSIEPFQRDVLAHCYRMLGSLHDAEDARQETLVRAWRALDRFEGRSSIRTWLHRIATNVCLDRWGDRPARQLPELLGPSGRADGALDVVDAPWLDPYPDAWLGTSSGARYELKEATTIAFMIALQLLPARQRAVLLLRDVVGLSAEEAATTLEMSVGAVTSALQRARITLDEHAVLRPVELDESARMQLQRYIHAWNTGDTATLISVLREDAMLSMPPTSLWVSGADEIVRLYDRGMRPQLPMRLVETRANGAPATAMYGSTPAGFRYTGLCVLGFSGDRIATIHAFMTAAVTPAMFGLSELVT
jgi:RNA polymerase sigma-70 factor, ECF subfamily